MTDIKKTAKLFIERNGVVEVRVIASDPKTGKKNIGSGYFDNVDALSRAIEKVDSNPNVSGVYATLNQPTTEHCHNLNQPISRNTKKLSDKDIDRYTWILIDLDPERETGTNSTAEELEAARLRRMAVCDALVGVNFPEPAIFMSGNGYHALYTSDLPVDDKTLVRKFLKALDHKFSDDAVKVDTTVYNPARITKLYGTMTRKGPGTPERPQRRSTVESIPDNIVVVTREQLQTVVDKWGAPIQKTKPLPMSYKAPPQRTHHTTRTPIDVPAWCQKAGLQIIGEKVVDGSTIYKLEHCAFNQEHKNNDASIIQDADGVVRYQCFHDSCQGRTFQDACKALNCFPDEWGGNKQPQSKLTREQLAVGADDIDEEPEETDPYIPEEAKVCLPSAMQNIVNTLENCSQTPPDIISLFLPVFTIPFLEGTVLKKSSNDPGRPPRLPVTVIGPSGSGKTTPLERTRILYKDLEAAIDEENKERIKTIHYLQAKLKKEKDPFQVSNLHAEIDENRPLHKVYQTQTGSRQGLCRALGDGSNPLVILDEIGRFISRASKGGPEADNMDAITELADQGCIRPPLLKGTLEQGPTKTIYGVSFGLYGTTTVEDLPQKKAANLLKGGFFSRQIMGVIDEVKGFPEKNYLTENELHQLRLWRDNMMDACRDAEYSFILDDSAREVFRQYRTKISQKFVISGNSHEHHAGQIIRRVKQAEDICLIFHASDPETNRNKYVSGMAASMATFFVDYFHERHHPKFLRFIEHGEEVATRHAIGCCQSF